MVSDKATLFDDLLFQAGLNLLHAFKLLELFVCLFKLVPQNAVQTLLLLQRLDLLFEIFVGSDLLGQVLIFSSKHLQVVAELLASFEIVLVLLDLPLVVFYRISRVLQLRFQVVNIRAIVVGLPLHFLDSITPVALSASAVDVVAIRIECFLEPVLVLPKLLQLAVSYIVVRLQLVDSRLSLEKLLFSLQQRVTVQSSVAFHAVRLVLFREFCF